MRSILKKLDKIVNKVKGFISKEPEAVIEHKALLSVLADKIMEFHPNREPVLEFTHTLKEFWNNLATEINYNHDAYVWRVFNKHDLPWSEMTIKEEQNALICLLTIIKYWIYYANNMLKWEFTNLNGGSAEEAKLFKKYLAILIFAEKLIQNAVDYLVPCE